MEEHPETPWFIAGVLDAHKRHSFERVLWRACRRTAFVRTAEIDDQFKDPDTVILRHPLTSLIHSINVTGKACFQIRVYHFLQWTEAPRYCESCLRWLQRKTLYLPKII